MLTLSPEGAGITVSKYVHAKSTLLKGTLGCLLAYAERDGPRRLCCCHTGPSFTTVRFLSHAGTQSGDRHFLTASS